MGFGMAFAMVIACTTSTPDVPTTPDVEAFGLPLERLDETWVVQLATEEALNPFATEPGWVSSVMKRDLGEAVKIMGRLGGLPAARAHADAAAQYRQAALIAANSLVEVYGKTPQPTDPVGAQHLVAVGHVLRGELPEARRAAEQLSAVERDPTDAWHAPWRGWLEGEGAWPPDLSSLPLSLPEPAVGRWPVAAELPHYSLPERTEDGRRSGVRRTMADPGALVALWLWHDAAAHTAAGEQGSLVDAYRAGYRVPAEGPVAPAGPLPLELLFGSDLLSPGDADFLADLHGDAGMDAVDAHADSSVLAWIASQARVEGALDAERAVDEVAELRAALLERTTSEAGGASLGHHRQFADIAAVGTLRSLALVAEVAGDRETSGKLRIEAYGRSNRATADPVGLLALAAWDASNRYPMRALDILHGQATRSPNLEIARYGLDVLGLRVGHERTGETPGM
ncbi:MAG: hypothetical protein KTR31_15985 [Myxococcales bacterium]|nr:hypothetical protein [Myxococcales bacterium]